MSTLSSRGVPGRHGRIRASLLIFPDTQPLKRRRKDTFAARKSALRPLFEHLEDLTLLSASILGTVWNDQNGDGLQQATEPGVGGATVYLDLNHDHQNDSTTVTVTPTSLALSPSPGELGAVAGGLASTLQVLGFPAKISDLQVNLDLVDNQPAGSAPVSVNVVSPLGITVPDLPTLMNIQAGQTFNGSFDASGALPITLATPAGGVITGTYQPQNSFTEPPAHIYDGNPNGTWGLVFFGDTTNLDLVSWSLTFKVPDPSTKTDASGNYSFTGLAPGSYNVEVAGASGQSQTSPAGTGAAQTVTLADGQAANNVNFGIQPASALTTTSFYLSSPAIAWGAPVTINYTLANQGLGDAPGFDVAVVLSNNGVISASGPVLKTFHVSGLAAGANTTSAITVDLPATAPAGFSSLSSSDIGFVIDPSHALAHNNASVGSNQGPGYDFTALATAPNVAITNNPSAQNDPSIAVDPTNPNHIVVAYMDFSLETDGYAGIGVSVSEDGGKSWTASSPVSLPSGFDQGAADPTVHFDGNGNVFISFMSVTFLGPKKPGLTVPNSNQRLDGFQSNNGIFVVQSTNGGTTWNQPVAVVSHTYSAATGPVLFEDIPDFAIDTFKTLPNGQPNPFYNDLYVTWVRVYPAGQFPGDPQSTAGTDIMVAVSQDGGQSWTTETQKQGGIQVTAIKDPNFGTDGTGSPGRGDMFYPQVSVGPGGDVYVSAYAAGTFDVFHSSDGGASFVAPNPAEGMGLPFPGINVLPYSSMFASGFRTTAVRDIIADPSHPGRVYVSDANYVFDSAVGGIVDSGEILFAVSNDYGRTWDPIFQVGKQTTNFSSLPPGENDAFLSVLNDDANGDFTAFDSGPQLNNEVLDGQVFPTMAVDAQGALSVIWYDTRRDPTQQNLDVFGTVSTNGGVTFTPNFRVTDTSFNPNNDTFTDANGNPADYLGDHIALAAANGMAYAVWTDTRTGNQNVEFQSYSLTTPPAAPVDRLYPDNTAATATPLGTIFAQDEVPKLKVGAANDNWFSLTAAASGDLVVTVTANNGDGANLELQLSDGTNVLPAVITPTYDSSGVVNGRQLVYPSVAGQTYYVDVSSGDGSTIAYTLVAGSLTADLGSSVQGTVNNSVSPGGLAVFRLQAAATGSINLTLNPNADTTGNLTLQVLTANGLTTLASGPAAGTGAGTPQTITIPVTQGDVILIEVAGADGNSGGDFALQYTNLDQYQTPGTQTLFFPTPSAPSSIAVGKLSSNGLDDIVTSSVTGADPVNVLLGNGDGTFQAAHQYSVGPGLSEALTAGYRQVALADLTGSGVQDIVVPNFRAGDVSVLLGNGNGTFQPQRTFDAVSSPDALVTGNFTGNGVTDVAVLQNFPQEGGVSKLAILIGRGDGTFKPAVTYPTIFNNGAGPMVVGDFTGNGIDDIMVFSKNEPEAELFLGNGDGTFQPGTSIKLPEQVFAAQAVDLSGNGILDLVITGTNTGNVYVMMGKGDGTFPPALTKTYNAMLPKPGGDVGVYGLAVTDFGSASGNGTPGSPDGLPDIIVTAQDRSGSGPGEVIMLPGVGVDSAGNYTLGAPVVLANLTTAGKIAVGDFTGNGASDIAATDNDGVLVIYGKSPSFAANTSTATARDLGSATHLVTLPETIVASQEDAYFTYTVPTEEDANSGPQVVDLSALFQDVQGAGLQMDVTDSLGQVKVTGSPSTSGNRVRIIAPQGDVLTIHIFGQTSSGESQGTGVYTLDIDVLPQVASVQAESVVPGASATSLVITVQGDLLDPAAAENPANYVVTWLGPDGLAGSADDVVIPVLSTSGNQPVVYDPSADLSAKHGLSYETAARQTITLNFGEALPAGSYQITLAPTIQAAAYNSSESSLLVNDGAFDGHPLVSFQTGVIQNGAKLVVANLVPASGGAGNLATISQGTSFLTQLQNDMSALLNELITNNGDDPAITADLNNQILSRFGPLFNTTFAGPVAPGTTAPPAPPSYTIIWFDPVSLDLQSSQGQAVSYSMSSNAVSSNISQSFVQVGGNVELVVMANAAGTFNLDASNIPSTARGGEVELSSSGSSSESLTSTLRENANGEASFQFDLSSSQEQGGGTSEGGGGGALVSAASSALAILSTGLVTPVALGGASSVTTIEGPEEGAAEAAAASTGTAGAPVVTPLPTKGGNTSGSDEDQPVPDLTSSGSLKPLVQSTLQFVKRVLNRASNLMNGMGMKPQSNMLQLWQGFVDALLRSTNPQNPQGAANQEPARNQDQEQRAPVAPALRVPETPVLDLEAIDRVLKEKGIEEIMLQDDVLAAAPLEHENAPSTADTYWATFVVAAALYQARLRIKARSRSASGESSPQLPKV